MANGFWIKLYHEILHDPKMGRLPDNVWRRCIELFLMAGELDQGGDLPPASDMVWLLRVNPAQFDEEIEQLITVGILTKREDGSLFVSKFQERQGRISAAEKQKAYRDRKRQAAVEGKDYPPEPPKNGAKPHQDQADTAELPQRYRPVTGGNADIDIDIDIDKSVTRSIESRVREPEEDREFAHTLMSVCGYSPDGPITDAVVRDISSTTQLMRHDWGVTSDQLKDFKTGYWWGKGPPTLKQIRDEWGRYLNADKQERKNVSKTNLDEKTNQAYKHIQSLVEGKSFSAAAA